MAPLPPHAASPTTCEQIIAATWTTHVAEGVKTPGTASRYMRVWASFMAYARAHGKSNLAEIDLCTCAAFVHAALPGFAKPTAATSRFRLTVIRAGFAVLLSAEAMDCDPTAPLNVVPQPPHYRPVALTPTEALRLRAASRMRPGDTLRPAAVELALAGLNHGEIVRAVVADLDDAASCVMVGGSGRNFRSVALEDTALQVLLRRVDAERRAARRHGQPWRPDMVPIALARPLYTYPLESVAPTISTNLTRALNAAGIYRLGVRPRSLREFAANRVYALTDRVEDVAAYLGMNSLDSARRLIDEEWQHQFGDEVRRDPG